MFKGHRAKLTTAALAAAMMLGGCASVGNVGEILGSVLGGAGGQGQRGQTGQVSGTIMGVDSRNQVIGLQQSNGQTVNLLFDNNTQVTFQNRNYPPTALERGDRVTVRVQQVSQGYYADLVQVDQSVSGSSGGTGQGGSVQQMQGVVQQVDAASGAFSVNLQNYGTVTVTLPYNASRTDVSRMQNLRRGDSVRFYGVFINNTRVELRQFN